MLGAIFSGGIAFMAYAVHIPFTLLTQGVATHNNEIMDEHAVKQPVAPVGNMGASKHSDPIHASHPNSDVAGKVIGTGLYAMMYLIG